MTNKALWTPSENEILSSNMMDFVRFINKKYDNNFKYYQELYDWSVENIEDFWESVWEYSGVIYSEEYHSICSADKITEYPIPRPKWFSGARLNFAENLLKYHKNNPDDLAIIHWAEDEDPLHISFEELYNRVAKCVRGLKSLGVKKGDRVAGFISNVPEAVVGMLATTSIGAVWTSCSPDFGFQGVLDRFGQTKPKVLIAVNGYSYGGKLFPTLERIDKISKEISEIEQVVILNKIQTDENISNPKFLTWEKLLDNNANEINFAQLRFDHPVYIMYSSGTTGTPKCIVHGAGGTLLQHWKELHLHTNLSVGDRISYFTTCGWMMWNWLVSSLNVGATLFLFDGSPGYPDLNKLWDAVDEEKLNVFGTSPKYLSACGKSNLKPIHSHSLSSLKSILSTGSPLSTENFDYVYRDVKKDVRLSSITGGTDIVSCFALGNPMLPVFYEELQCLGLGMKVESWSEDRKSLVGETGELVCLAPFPSMPVGFWEDDNNQKYFEAYFDYFEGGIWRHGDFVEITERGGMIVLGRSDATLNPGGVRIGTAEIYRITEAMDEVTDSIVVGLPSDNDVIVVLFVVLRDDLVLGDELIQKIKANIKLGATPRHVPKIIKQVSEIPVTISGKKVELAVQKTLNNQEVTNKSALANPDSLKQFENIM
jgi:acetoacetyl-CoA synthetase